MAILVIDLDYLRFKFILFFLLWFSLTWLQGFLLYVYCVVIILNRTMLRVFGYDPLVEHVEVLEVYDSCLGLGIRLRALVDLGGRYRLLDCVHLHGPI